MLRPLIAFVAFALVACSNGSGSVDQPTTSQEIPVTSKSKEALEHFKTGRDLAENIRSAEAAREFEAALKLDPDFALARAYYGSVLPDPQGLKEIEQAMEQSASFPQPERVRIAAMHAGRRGEFAKAAALWKELADATPGDWRAHAARGGQLYSSQNYAQAIEALKKATQLNPKAGTVYNMLGYAQLQQGDSGPAIEAFKQYVSLAEREPNPQDSLAEGLMAAGQLTEAEAAFRKAVEISPTFGISWEGIAYTKFFAGDTAAANAALEQARAAAARPSDKTNTYTIAALATLGQGKLEEGLKQLDTLEKFDGASPAEKAFVPIFRAISLIDASKFKEALAEVGRVTQVVDAGQLPPGATNNLRRWALTVKSATYGWTGNVPAAKETLAIAQKAATDSPDDPQLPSAVKFANGMLAVAEKNLPSAQSYFDQCAPVDAYCHWVAFRVSQKLGNSAGAQAARSRLIKMYVRDPTYLYARLALNRTSSK